MGDWVAKYWVQWLFGLVGAVLTGVGAGAVAYAKKRMQRVNALEEKITGVEKALRASLYDRLYYLHGKYLRQGWVSVPDLENITGIYEGYHALGGNSVGTKLYEDMRCLPSFGRAAAGEDGV